MASEIAKQLYSRTVWIADGVDTIWNFAFTGGYIDPSHIGAMTRDLETDEVTIIPIDVGTMLTGPFQLTVVPAVAEGLEFTIFRNTPKNLPIVSFQDGGRVSAESLDTNYKQSVFIAAESIDAIVADVIIDQSVELTTDDFGFKSLKRNLYTGSSSLNTLDNGRAHYKTDGTDVTITNAHAIEFLTTIVNNSDSPMTLTFSGCSAILQGSPDPGQFNVMTLSARNVATLWKPANGLWFISGLLQVVS